SARRAARRAADDRPVQIQRWPRVISWSVVARPVAVARRWATAIRRGALRSRLRSRPAAAGAWRRRRRLTRLPGETLPAAGVLSRLRALRGTSALHFGTARRAAFRWGH